MTRLLLLVAASLAAPYLVLRERTLRRWLAVDAVSWLVALALARLDVVDPYLGVVAFAVVKLAMFAVALASAPARDVRWSAGRAALVAGVVYAGLLAPMLRTPIDGDEPFYLLVTESLVRDRDVDLRNQYRDLAHSETGRTDLQPQFGDPKGPHGEQYSRHELLLPLLMTPGYAVAGLAGALLTLALFGALLARSVVRLLEDEGIDDATIRIVFPFVALAPPLLFYAVRIWPEVPAAWLFTEAVRGVRQRRAKRWIPALFTLVLLKLRFLLVAVVLVLRTIAWRRRSGAAYSVLAAMFVVPLVVVYAVSGSFTNVHHWWELLPGRPLESVKGLFGLIVDGAEGIAFQAPFYLLGVLALARWRAMPGAFRVGVTSATLYLLYLIPRPEWDGGWSPPLRYVAFLMPMLALGAATLLQSMRRDMRVALLVPIGLWTTGLVVHGVAFPWRLFRIGNGESNYGEWLSSAYHADVSRLVPSLIRLNTSGIMAAIAFVVLFAIVAVTRRRWLSPALIAPLATVLLACGFVTARKPGDRVDFEDAHVVHHGGLLYPELYATARFAYRGGWILERGDSMEFLAKGGKSRLYFRTAEGATIELGGQAYELPATGGGNDDDRFVEVELDRDGRTVLRDLAGTVNLDRLEHE